jgi:SAM-dependent methyltransferase
MNNPFRTGSAEAEHNSFMIDFGYPWWLTYGHLVVFVGALTLLLIAYRRKWSKWAIVPVGVLTLWAATAALAVHLFDINSVASMPTESFLRSGTGRVLDLGAGTGRSSIMVLTSRPQTTLVALDLFGESFDHHFGPGLTPQQRLLANLKAAGVDQRASITTADMRKLPFEAAAFDAIVSSYAIDHLGRDGIREALAEAARVVKPGGEFLLMVVGKDKWLQYTFGPLLMHGGLRGRDWWTARVQEAGFDVVEDGMAPATLYVLARRSP